MCRGRALKRDGAITENDLSPSVFDFLEWNSLRSKSSFRLELRKGKRVVVCNHRAMDVGGSLLSAKEAYELTLASWVPSKPSKFIYKSMVAEPDLLHETFFLESTTQSEIVEIVNSLRLNTATGHDKIPMWSVKESINYISELLTYILNLSINSGIVPVQMKLARVVPLYKSGDKRSLSTNRPVSVLPVFSKFLEKAVYNRLIHFFDKYEILYNNQYGFGKKRSTSVALLYLHDKITSAIDERKHTVGIFLDLSKASDSTP